MQVNNNSNGSVTWSQSGSNPQSQGTSTDNGGTLAQGGTTGPFTPKASSPYWVVFSNGHQPVVSEDIRDANATVTLTEAWKIEIT